MIRKAFLMEVNEGSQREYEARHNPVWEELESMLKQHGVNNYSIYLDPHSNQLFGYAEVENEEQWANIASTDICQKWWAHMKDIMPFTSDNRPKAAELREVFHMD